MIDLKGLNFPDGYFESEECCGFYITGMMKRLWAVQMNILSWIDEVCRKYGIHYIMDYGSMLGAVRHSGYIPWDDDLDIGMLRRDYNRFMGLVVGELPPYLSVKALFPEAVKPKEMIFGISNGTRLDTSPEFLERFYGCPYSTGVDIFVYDRVPEDPEQFEYQDSLIRALDRLLMLQWEVDDGSITEERRQEYKVIKESVENELDYSFSENENKSIQILRLLDIACSLCEDCGSKNVECREYSIYKGDKGFREEYFIDTIQLPFEGIMSVPVPRDYDTVLRNLYGEYMEQKMFTSSHDYPIYHNQRDELYRQYNIRGWKIPEEFLEYDKEGKLISDPNDFV
ncbi:lipopolysaccharide cholinephosphotransferase [Butyrivibrio fibrisolvens]|uniref:Lipopolysaccharide cholinephosphotransferase n=1 Tax=Butyrivibrio fibrisolvens TaxID=831 RepID=A0A1H9TV18_BUTFI|nr:LicD family protein [Butyrivibrio fibrisolvens]SES00767.1 lipopolysaccharide cholinephosphotransferase [Butyrivibrio fibrisolvens]